MEKESKGFLFLLMNWTTELIKGKPFQGNLKIHGKALKKSLEMIFNLC